MAYFPSTFPAVAPTLDDRHFWELCAARRLCFQRCVNCKTFRHPPAPFCPRCQSLASDWVEAPTVATIFSFTVVYHPSHSDAISAVPYNVVLVEFESCSGVRLVSNVIDESVDALTVGARVELAWDAGTGGQWLPRFRLLRLKQT
ncbi:MAG: hypothetical protein EBY28_06245 [Betaproteobacteria bacterium]|nr:hypothetical protein [Betaproteobacteria bacterium]